MSLASEARADSPPVGLLAADLMSSGSFGFHHMLPTHLITSASLLGACLNAEAVSQRGCLLLWRVCNMLMA